jgi:heparanase 1
MTRRQWDALHAFARRNGLDVVFTLNVGPGVRNGDGSWNPDNAEQLMAYNAERDYPVAVWELGNELNIFWFVHGLDAQVSARQYHQDLRVARGLARRYSPGSRFAAQGSAVWPVLGEPLGLFFGLMPQYLKRSGEFLDLVSWHYYPQQSRRGPVASRRAYPSRLLDPDNLDEAAHWAEKLSAWRDRYVPGTEIWLGETGNAQFGGEPGLSDVYLGGLWWLDQLGLLARTGHSVVVRQTLSGMNYGMIEDETLDPRPDYWNSVLWKRLMGVNVYEATISATGSDAQLAEKVRVYAHSTPGAAAGSATILAINLDHERDVSLTFPAFEGRTWAVFALNSPDLFGTNLLLNGTELTIADDQALPPILPVVHSEPGVPEVPLCPLSYAFVYFPAEE